MSIIDRLLNSILPDQTLRIVPTNRQKLFHEEVDRDLNALLPDGSDKTPVEPKRLERALKKLARDPWSNFDVKRE